MFRERREKIRALAGAGELDRFAMMPPAQVKPLIAAMRGPKKSG